jgi:hypothetical protein
MRLIAKLFAPLIAASALALGAGAQSLTLETGMTEPIHLSRPAASVVVGNQNIADVAVADPRTILLTGKSFGRTNLLVLDGNGNITMSADIVVTTNSASLVTINRGGSSYTYDCAGECRDAPVLGDEQGHFARSIDQAEQLKRLTEN